MENVFALFAGLLVVIFCLSLGRALLPTTTLRSISRWEALCLAYLCGAAITVICATAWLAAGLSFGLFSGFFVLAGALTMNWRGLPKQGLASDVSEPQPASPRPSWSPADMPRWQFALLTVLGLASVAATLALPINEFDPLLHFAYKGKVLTELGNPLDPAITSMMDANGQPAEFGRIVTHPNYPLGVPILEALVAKLSFWHARWVQLPLALWALCLPAAVYFGMRQVNRRAATAGALVAASTPILYARDFLANGWSDLDEVGLGNNLTLGAGADLPLAAMLTGAIALFLIGRRQQLVRLQILGGLCLAASVLMKNEGLALFGVTGLALLLGGAFLPGGASQPSGSTLAGSASQPGGSTSHPQAQRQWRQSLLAFGIAVLAILPWLHLRGQLPSIDENYGEHFNVERILHFLGGGEELVHRSPKAIVGLDDELLANPPARMDHLPGYFWEEFTDWRSWGLLWLLLLLALPWRLAELRDRDRRWLTLLIVGGVSLYFLIMLVTPWYLPLLREKGIPERLFLHLLGPIAMLIGWRLDGSTPVPAASPTQADQAKAASPEAEQV